MFGLTSKASAQPATAIDWVVGGEIAALGLVDWWFTTFPEAEREWMADTYAPMGSNPANGRPLVDGRSGRTPSHAPSHLALLATWFSKPGHHEAALLVANKSLDLMHANMPVIDRHFAYANLCKVFYRWRDTVPGAFERAIEVCEACISFHEQAAAALRAEMGMIPAHGCFRQLRIIEEKRGNYARAIQLCEMAKAAGWADDWDHQIARLTRKQARQS